MALLQARCDGRRQYEIANAAKIHPTILSSLINDIRPVRADDPRVIAIGAALGLQPSECFSDDNSKS
jgi:hypothetical protein